MMNIVILSMLLGAGLSISFIMLNNAIYDYFKSI